MDTRAERYAEAAIASELDALANTTSGRNAALNKAAFALGGFVAAGALGEEAAIKSLEQACETNGYGHKDGRCAVRASIKSGLKKGMETPRDLPRATSADNQQMNGRRHRQTLAELAPLRKIPIDALQHMRWEDTPRGIAIRYMQRDGTPARTQYREPSWNSDRFAWDPEGRELPIVAFDPDQGALARELGYLLVCEGAMDAATANFAGLPVVGIPGDQMLRKTLKAHHLEGVSRVFVCVDTNEVGDPDSGGERFRVDVPRHLETLGYTGAVHELRMPSSAKDMSELWVRLGGEQAGFVAAIREAMRAAEKAAEPKPLIEWIGTAEIFAPLPPMTWVSQGLQLCAGRPAMIGGYGASAKTLSAQSLALSVAAGGRIWERFDAAAGPVKHLDYEQGTRSTRRRYQRLAIGHGIEPEDLAGRLEVAVFPSVYLDSPNAQDAYASACDGASLVLLDALRGATPTMDENDSKIRACIDNLTRVSEKTGTAFLVIHHAGKPKDNHSDQRMPLRGSSGIFDACGSVLLLTAGKTPKDPRAVTQTKVSDNAEGDFIDPFLLVVEDVAAGANPKAGVRVMYQEPKAADPYTESVEKSDKDVERLLVVIRENQGATQNTIVMKSGIGRPRARQLLDTLEEEGRVHVLPGPRKAKTYRVEVPS